MVQKEELFIKSLKLQQPLFIIKNQKAEFFKIETMLINELSKLQVNLFSWIRQIS